MEVFQLLFKKNIIPENSIDAIASWYVFMCKILSKDLIFNYYEPSWDWIKKIYLMTK